jgi:hypothetical protein
MLGKRIVSDNYASQIAMELAALTFGSKAEQQTPQEQLHGNSKVKNNTPRRSGLSPVEVSGLINSAIKCTMSKHGGSAPGRRVTVT